ncbi:DUF397 domain-containing protein [Streptomyces sp. TP-A0874]|uniref:DUF397 domain-containing protein n=1 Tax=Streptomyces sp. TP-A0874 TaxID=549819 RepID=UPI0008534D9F|nr:DUF397 domain-containing protein [Streptomyces sp. TP-A0874]
MSIDDSSQLAVAWWKSSHSAQTDCVEFGIVDERAVAVRDSKNPTGPALLLSRGRIASFVSAVRDGLLDA